MTPRRIALVVLATAGLLFFAVMLFGGTDDSGVGPAGSVAFGLFATGSAVAAGMAAQGGQRHAWIAVAIGLAGWTTGNAVWCYVALGGAAPISNSSAAELGYVVLPLFALAAAVLVPSRDGSMVWRRPIARRDSRCRFVVGGYGHSGAERSGHGELPGDPVGRRHGVLSRAGRDGIDRHAESRARPQALAGAIVRWGSRPSVRPD